MGEVTAGPPTSVLVLLGQTASGKTIVALEAATFLDIEIINADARQMYRGLTIGTAKPTRDQLQRVQHHCINTLSPHEEYSAGQFQWNAWDLIEQIHARGKVVMLVGGSGLYLRAVVEGLFEGPPVDRNLRKDLRRKLETEGITSLVERLHTLDPETATTIDVKNPERVLRALEVCLSSGTPFSQLKREKRVSPPYRFFIAGLEWERTLLYQRIDLRAKHMLADGLIDEVRNLLAAGVPKDSQALKTVGYQETISYLESHMSMDDLLRSIQQHTRNYAKRQATWFRKMKSIHWYRVPNESALSEIAGNICSDYARFIQNTDEGVV